MLISDTVLTGPTWLVASLLQCLALLLALLRAPWRLLLSASIRSHLLLGTTVLLTFFWQMSAPMAPEVQLHLLGMTTVTLLLGAPLAILAGSLAAAGVTALSGGEAAQVLPHALVNATVPALTTHALLHLILRHGPRNIFMYMLGVGFFGGGLTMLAVLLSTAVLLALMGQAHVMTDWLSPLMLLAIFPEGFLNGAVVSSLAVYKPDWLKTFDDKHFLDGP